MPTRKKSQLPPRVPTGGVLQALSSFPTSESQEEQPHRHRSSSWRIQHVDFASKPVFAALKKMLWGERRGQWHHRRSSESMERPMPQLNDLSRSLVVLEQDATLIAVIEMGQSSWLVAGIVPGVERSPLKKLAVDESALLKLLNRWREEAEKAGHRIERIAIAFEAGR